MQITYCDEIVILFIPYPHSDSDANDVSRSVKKYIVSPHHKDDVTMHNGDHKHDVIMHEELLHT